jgi:hypothetical protein
MTDRDLIAAIAREIEPNPWFRRDRLVRLGKLSSGLSTNDHAAIRTSENKAARIVAKLREIGALG